MKHDQVSIRDAVLEDAPGLVAVVRRSITELCADEYRSDPAVLERWLANKNQANFERWIADDGHHVVVAEVRPQIAGVGMMTREGEIQLDYVSPDFRFRGVSKALLARMESDARALGLSEIWLFATQLASSMYVSAGCEVVREVESRFGTLPGLHMRKLLSG